MIPAFRILADRQDITSTIKDRLISLQLVDVDGFESDTLEIKLDDRNHEIELPPREAKLKLLLGYEETALVDKGRFVVDELILDGPPYTLTIRAKAADMTIGLKAQKTRNWDLVTFGDVLAKIASEHGLKPMIDSELAAVAVPHIAQTDESDLHLLTRLSKEYDAVAKVNDGYLQLFKRGQFPELKTKITTIAQHDILKYNATSADRDKYNSVIGYWHDTENGIKVEIQTGEGKPVYRLRHTYPDPDQTLSAAKGKLAALKRGTGTLSLTLVGNAALIAEGHIVLADPRTGLEGEWLMQRITHSLSNSGFITRVRAQTPKIRGVR